MTDNDWQKLKKELDEGKAVIFSKKQAENLLRLERYTNVLESIAKRDEAYNLVKGSIKSFAVFIIAIASMLAVFWDGLVSVVKGALK